MPEAYNARHNQQDEPQLTPEQEGIVADFEDQLSHDIHGNPVDPNGTPVDPDDERSPRTFQGAIVEAAAKDVLYYQNLIGYARNREGLPLDPQLQGRLRKVAESMPAEIAGRAADNFDYLDYLGNALHNEPLENTTKVGIAYAMNRVPSLMGVRTAADTSYYDELHTVSRDTNREQSTRDLAAHGIAQAPRHVGERLADDQPRHQAESARLVASQGSPEVQELIRSVLDSRVAALRQPYEKPATDSPEYKEEFHNLLNNIINAAADGPASNGQWTQLRDQLANELKRALKNDKDQIVYVQNAQDLLQGHVDKAQGAFGKANKSFEKAKNDHKTAKRRLVTGDPTYGVDPEDENDPLAPPPGVLPIEPMSAGHRVPQKMEWKYGGDAAKHWIQEIQAPRLRDAAPFGKRGKAAMERYLHRYEDAQIEAGRNANYTGLAISAAETGDYGSIKNQQMLNYEQRKLNRFKEILSRVDQLSAASDPDALQQEHGKLENEADVAVYEAGLRDALLEWRHQNTPEADHEVFLHMNRARNYLNDVVDALDGMSTYNRRYGKLLYMHDNIRRIHNTAAHHIMLQRWENATNDNGNFRGRYPVHFMPDMGIYQEDGSGDIYYPDGSTARVTGMNPDGSERVKRLDHNGYYWVEPENEDDQQQSRRRGWRGLLNRLSGEQTEAPITGTVHELRSETEKLADLTFVDPTDKNRENTARHASAWATEAWTELNKNLDRDVAKARNQARAKAEQEARDAAQAAGEEYDADKAATKIEAAMIRAGRDARKNHVQDGGLTVHYNVATYQTYFHGFRPGEPQLANGPHIRNDGAIILPGHHFYGRDADWALWPNGALEELDAAGNVVKSYTNDGKVA